MEFALLFATAVPICAAVQWFVRRRWFALFLSVVATLLVWLLVSLGFASVAGKPIFGTGRFATAEAVLGAAAIAQLVALVLKRIR